MKVKSKAVKPRRLVPMAQKARAAIRKPNWRKVRQSEQFEQFR